MVRLYDSGVYLLNGKSIVADAEADPSLNKEEAKKGTMAYGILQSHNVSGDEKNLKIKFDAITSHDLTYVGIIQTARASGLDRFPLPYVLTCCHNSLCAFGGTINEDDHVFGLTACKKYGGIFLPPHMGVIHQYMREALAGGGKMILGSDSHTRYVTLYARSKNVTASSSEVSYAELDGAEFVYGMQIQEITEQGPVFRRSIFDEEDRVIGSEEELIQVEADSTIISISQVPRAKLTRTTEGLEGTEKGLLRVDENYMTTREGVFGAGDVITGAKTVVHAVNDAKKAADAMVRYMEGL